MVFYLHFFVRCDIRTNHASHKYLTEADLPVQHSNKKFVKGEQVKFRTEPTEILKVLKVLAALKKMPVEEIADQCYKNTIKLFKI